MRLRLSMPFAAALCCAGCGSALGSAIAEFDAGRLPQAAAQLRELEPTLPGLPAGDGRRYRLYRGLTELALGNSQGAERWLSPLKRALDRDPMLLSDRERGALAAAWASMGHMPGE